MRWIETLLKKSVFRCANCFISYYMALDFSLYLVLLSCVQFMAYLITLFIKSFEGRVKWEQIAELIQLNGQHFFA